MAKKEKPQYLLGYRARGINLYKTKLKPMGYVVAGLGFSCLGIAVFPNGLGFAFYPLGFFLLSLVGINLNIKKKLNQKYIMFKYKRGWL